MTPDDKTLVEKNISDAYAMSIEDILIRFYCGEGKLTALIDSDDALSRSTYYRLKSSHPDEFTEIDREAYRQASEMRSSTRRAFDAQHEDVSFELQENARAELMASVSEMGHIARGIPYTVEALVSRRNRETGQDERVLESKTVVPYPRDRVSAFNALLTVAKDGIVPEKFIATKQVFAAEQLMEEKEDVGLPPLFSANSTFKEITATRKDGTTYTATVDDPDLIVIEEFGEDS